VATGEDDLQPLFLVNGAPLAGTYRLDGMLQGPLGPDGPADSDLIAWTAATKAGGLHFHLSLEGNSFSIVADPAIGKTSAIPAADLAAHLAGALENLIGLLPPASRPGAFSTVRSEEFRPGTAVQTVYMIRPTGAVAAEQRVVETATAAAPPEITARSLRRAALPALLLLMAGLFASSFFIDYRKLFTDARDQIAPLAKEEIILDTTALGGCVEVELAGIEPSRDSLVLRLKRGPRWNEAIQSTPAESSTGWPDFLARQAVHQRRLRVDFLSKDGKPLGSGEISLESLHPGESGEVVVGARLAERLAKVVVRP
jgi:hypothetical protein